MGASDPNVRTGMVSELRSLPCHVPWAAMEIHDERFPFLDGPFSVIRGRTDATHVEVRG